MLIIWRGLGFLVPLIGIAALLAPQSVIGNGYYQSHGWPKFVAGVVVEVTRPRRRVEQGRPTARVAFGS